MFSVHSYTGSDGRPLRYGVLSDPQRDKPIRRSMLFLPGLGGSVKGALDFLTPLLPYCDPIYAPDLRGFGLNNEEPLPHPDVYLSDLRAFQQQIVSETASYTTLCGISLGGTIATRYAVAHAGFFDSLILIAPAYKPSALSFTPFYIVTNVLNRLFRGKHSQTTLPYAIEALTRNPEKLNDPEYKDREPLRLPSDFLLHVSLFNLEAYRQTDRLSLPTLVIVPERDRVCDPLAMQKGFHRIPTHVPKCLKTYPELYHDVLMEPEVPTVAADVVAWLQSLVSESVKATQANPQGIPLLHPGA